jgi:hypothetical protein
LINHRPVRIRNDKRKKLRLTVFLTSKSSKSLEPCHAKEKKTLTQEDQAQTFAWKWEM